MDKHIDVHYYALFRDARGKNTESVTTRANSPRELYEELGLDSTLRIETGVLRVAVNDAFTAWDSPLLEGDLVVFIAPTSGG